MYDEVARVMRGRIGMSREEGETLGRILKGMAGLHVEIGVLWGGTAILAAKAKGGGHVVGIDPMNTSFWTNMDPAVPLDRLSVSAIHENFSKFSVGHMISLVVARSYPWPLPGSMFPTSALIDGDHDEEWVLRDWNSLRTITQRVIFFHDYDEKHVGVMNVVDNFVRTEPGWRVNQYGTLIVADRAQ